MKPKSAFFFGLLLLTLFLLAAIAEAQSHNDKFYKILEIPKDASPRQIKKAYRKLSSEWHPDRAQTEEDRKIHHEKMIELNKAFEILGDSEKKKLYDMYGEEQPKPQMQAHPFGDILNTFFGGAFGQGFGHGGFRQPRQQQRQQQCMQTVTCQGNHCTQTTVCH